MLIPMYIYSSLVGFWRNVCPHKLENIASEIQSRIFK